MKKFKYPLILVLLFSIAVSAPGELNDKAGKTVASWLKVGVGGRAAGMGEAYSPVCNDATAMFWNPARLVKVEKPQVLAQYGMWLVGTGYHAIGFAKPILDKNGRLKDVLGIGIIYFTSGNMRYTENINDAVKFDSELTSKDWFVMNGSAMSISYGQVLSQSLSAGYTLKMIGETMLGRAGIGFALDAGIVYAAGSDDNFNIALALQNVGTPIEGYELPQNIKLGAGITLGKLLLVADLNIQNDHAPKLNAGLEFKLTNLILLRCGYMLGRSEDGLDMTGLSTGIGLSANDLSLDIALVPFGTLGDTCRTSIVIKF